MAFKSSAGTTPYQPAPSIQPKYGFRYSGSNFAPSMSPSNIPPVNYTIPAYEAPTVAPTPYADNTSMIMGSDGDSDNGSSAASTQMSIDQANNNISNANIGQDFGLQTVHGPTFNPMSVVPGFGMMASINAPAVPTSGYGTPGTVSSITGGTFDQQGRSIDPITGYANPEYATMKASVNQFMDDPLGNILGDPKNAFDYDPDSKKSQTVQFSEAKGLDTDKAATKDLLNMGISEASAQPGTATHDAQLGIGYSNTGAAPTGSQFSSTGVFSTESPSGGPDSSNPESTGSTGVSVSNSSYSDDAQSSGSSGSCCFIMLEARYGNGTMDNVVRRYRDEHMTVKNKRGYYKVAEVFIPLMRKSKVFKWLVTKTFADPLVSYGKWYYKENKHGWIFAPVKSFWLNIFNIVGTDTKFIRENGDIV